ncbi:MAG: hypothetical protein AVO33_06440 [delta proteobacterium ML8_F1]|nr:MAG: hypothetical protein AVO33_06440 [delta proteobacterium ML8_F1]
MKIIVTDSLRDYLKRKKKYVVSVKIRKVTGGCGGFVQEVEVQTNQVPKEVDQYIHETVNDIEVYVIKNLKPLDDTLTLDLKKPVIFGSAIDVKGIQLKL